MDGASTFLNYDFQTKKGISSILQAVRESELSASEKAELRDLIFHYTSGGYDDSVKVELEKRLQASKIKITTNTIEKKEINTPVEVASLSFGTMRPEPIFHELNIDFQNKAVSSIEQEVKPTIPIEVRPITKDSFKQENNVVANTIKEVEEVKVVSGEIKTEELVNEKQVFVSADNTKEVVKDSVLDVKIENNNKPNLVGLDNLERIKQIKFEINNKIGNPVNLVDINNQIGREYMSALLDAMKKINASTPHDITVAMERLEKAYLDVTKIISNLPNSQTTSTEPLVKEKVKEESNSPEVLVVENKPEPKIDSVTVQARVEEEVTNSKNEFVVNEVTNSSGFPSTPKVASDSFTKVEQTSLIDEKKLPSFSDIPKVLPTNLETPADPLFNTEIDRGLDQLLSDWSLFKKSGLFGTGPKGREHPLFKKISGLQIPLLLAGRFEGANQEIRQSITDYMNGWRYEQGIIYEQGEIFEVYLRRVIKHIIDLQKRKTNP